MRKTHRNNSHVPFITKGALQLNEYINDTYHINENTLAIVPARHIEYQTIVYERDRKVLVRQTPFEIVKFACLNEWFTYDGRRNAVMYHTNFKRKIPIPICPQKQIYLFPTSSSDDFDNVWISFKHIIITQESPKDPKKSIVIFNNNTMLTLNISHYTLRKQMDRTFEIMYRMEKFIASSKTLNINE